VEADIQLNMIGSMLDFMKSWKGWFVTQQITGDATELIGEYNKLVLDRNRILKSATESNPSVIKPDSQIESLKSNVSASLTRMKSNLKSRKEIWTAKKTIK
jgi:hypothetical protein